MMMHGLANPKFIDTNILKYQKYKTVPVSAHIAFHHMLAVQRLYTISWSAVQPEGGWIQLKHEAVFPK
jgi:hypothetical protein